MSVEDPNFVDLGLPSGTKWAKFNIGASTPYEGGDMIQWGQTNGSYYTWDAESYFESRYAAYKHGTPMYDQDDYAIYTTDNQRIPTNSEFNELIENCTGVVKNDKYPRYQLLTSKINGKTIIFPLCGGGGGNENDYGEYFSRTTHAATGQYLQVEFWEFSWLNGRAVYVANNTNKAFIRGVKK